MRILFATIAPPYPPTYGQRLRNWALVRAMRESGHEIVLVTFAGLGDEQHYDALSALCGKVRLVPMPEPGAGWRRHWSRLKRLPSRLPEGALRFRSPEMAKAIAEYIGQVDAAICDDVYLRLNFPDNLRVPLILNKHDLVHVILKRYVAHRRNPFLRLYAGIEAAKLRRWELACVRQAYCTMCCSALDAGIIRAACPGVKLSVVPNVIDTDRYTPQGECDGDGLLYSGSMEWYPNRDAVCYFLEQIFPRIRSRVPAVSLTVTGAPPDRSFVERLPAGANVHFTGFVPDIRAVIARSRILVVPLRIGSGTRLKILEAGAMGKPVVSTRVGAEGLDFVHGEDILLADEPGAFADAVTELLGDRNRRRELGARARQRVVDRYGLPAVSRTLADVLSGVARSTFGTSDAG